MEFLWPNVTGRYFPDECRWAFILDSEQPVWIPSQYIGLWAFLLAAGGPAVSRAGEMFAAGGSR